MRHAFVGFIPWVLFWSFAGPGLWTPAIGGALLAAGLLVGWRWFTRRDLKTMELVTLGYFCVHALITLVIGWPLLKTYGPIANSLVLAGSPFTYQYAREDWPRPVERSALSAHQPDHHRGVGRHLPLKQRGGRAEPDAAAVQHSAQRRAG